MAGRPTDYREDYNTKAEKLCKLGATDKELADFFEVAESTINEWKLTYPEFSESIKKGKVLADANVAQSLYKRAVGFKAPDLHFSAYEGHVTQTEYTKHYPPDPTSMIFWLKNRQPSKWRDKHEFDHTTLGEKIKFGGIEILAPSENSQVSTPAQP